MRQLPVKLVSAERDRLLREHLDLELEIERLIAKRTEVNAEIRPKAKRSAEIVHKLDDDTELRDVRCAVHELDDTNEISIVRLDTDPPTEVERRTMTAAERQGEWDWSGATQAKVDAAQAGDEPPDDVIDADFDDAGETDPLPVTEENTSRVLAGTRKRLRKAKRSSKGKPAKRTKGQSLATAR